MTNRELLDLAALAAGHETTLYTGHVYIHDGTATRQWNPLENDGDAFRLMVKLSMEIDCCSSGVAVRVPCGLKVLVDASEVKCEYAATRLAIVKAAAEIGRGMKEQQ